MLNGFAMVFVSATIGLDGFSMVANHWSNDGMVTIHRYGLMVTKKLEDLHKKLISGLWAIGAMKRPVEQPNGHLPENRRYPE